MAASAMLVLAAVLATRVLAPARRSLPRALAEGMRFGFLGTLLLVGSLRLRDAPAFALGAGSPSEALAARERHYWPIAAPGPSRLS
jgi:hypothetical protein